MVSGAARPRVVLASSSPRRRELLRLAGLVFAVHSPQVDESPHADEEPLAHVRRLSLDKAASAAAHARQVAEKGAESVVIAADTVVVYQGEVLGKPATPDEAVQMLRRLRGETHQVHTGLAVCFGEGCASEVVTTAVHMRPYTEAEIAAYVASGDPMDKAGAYAIQHAGFSPVASLEGCYANVVGLPLCALVRLLDSLHVDVPRAHIPCDGTSDECVVRSWALSDP